MSFMVGIPIGDGKANFVSGCLVLSKNTTLYSVNLPQALIQDYLIIKKFHILDDNLNKPREFCIELDASMKHSFDNILMWLAHEMVHLKQFVRKELWDYESGSVQWKSKRYVRSPEYDDMPWEREAYRLEGELYEMFEEWYYE